tara:strand:+ start:201 stop:851 length:651 start_codon:yes stop_codon:yes gene_type:complete
MSIPEEKIGGNIIGGILLILSLTFIGYCAFNYTAYRKEKNKPITSEYFRYLKFEEARKNGFITFYSVSDGPIKSSVNLKYDSFTEKFQCTFTNSGSFKIDPAFQNVYIKFKEITGYFSFIEPHYVGVDKRMFIKYRLDNGNIINYQPEYRKFPKGKYYYLDFPHYLFKNAQTVSIRYGQKNSSNNFVKTENFKTKTVDSIYNYYRLCKDPDYVPTN